MKGFQNSFNPLVSVVMPVYNGAAYVKQALDSVLVQTYKNIEIVVVNDGSTDNSEEIINTYKNKIRYFKKVNGGVATALNLAIKNSKGKYISWLSHDDLYLPDKINVNIKYLSALDPEERDKTILYSNYFSIDENSNQTGETHFQLEHPLIKLNSPLYPILKGLIHGCTLLIPKKCFDEVGLFNPNLRSTQDYDLWFSMFPKYHVRFIDSVTVKGRYHNQQDSKKHLSSTECDNLWIKMIEGIGKKDMDFISGSEINFYEDTLKLATAYSYIGATHYLQQKIHNYYKHHFIRKVLNRAQERIIRISPFK
jgi:glycosyltransferase involved in cell wall biosynthesis